MSFNIKIKNEKRKTKAFKVDYDDCSGPFPPGYGHRAVLVVDDITLLISKSPLCQCSRLCGALVLVDSALSQWYITVECK